MLQILDMSSNKLTGETKKRAKDLNFLAVKILLQLGIAENILSDRNICTSESFYDENELPYSVDTFYTERLSSLDQR